MTNLRTYVALTATIAFIALGQSMNAQDDLDDLLADLEGEAPAATPAAPAPAPAQMDFSVFADRAEVLPGISGQRNTIQRVVLINRHI